MKNCLFLLITQVTFVLHSQNTDKWSLVNHTLDRWHQAAADARFADYFSEMTDDAVFIGTDANENWNITEFKQFAKPFFDRGRAWNFKSLNRHIYFNAENNLAWFDELLDTQMKICRGSGVMRLENGQWKIAHFVLSITVPNEFTDAVVKIKSTADEHFMTNFKK